jgi:hypothetical protein
MMLDVGSLGKVVVLTEPSVRIVRLSAVANEKLLASGRGYDKIGGK